MCCSTENTAVEEASSLDDIIEAHDENGNPITLQVVRYFYHNTDEYVVLQEANQTDTLSPAGEEPQAYIMKVDVELEDGEEIEVFSPVEDDDLYDSLVEIAFSKYTLG
ncbi:MAG: DUF1292 domain-containing protein [Eubacteriales bacterium]|nr:DUF1292 domain-containing protein [Eubacteriales bacterium]